VLIAVGIRLGRPRRLGAHRLAALRLHWLFVAAAGLASALFGLAYGEFFGPTGLQPLWLDPMEQPVSLRASASSRSDSSCQVASGGVMTRSSRCAVPTSLGQGDPSK
jgi:hypothetical protein